MKIVMVITSYHPIVGGAERQLAQVAALLQQAGNAVTVITRHHAGLPYRETVGGIAVQRIAAAGSKPAAALRFVVGAARAIRRERPDVVHCHSLHSPVLAGLLGAALAGRVPVVAKPMCSGEMSAIAQKPLGRLRLWAMRRGLARIISISSDITAEATALGFAANRISFVPNGVDSALFSPRDTDRGTDGLPQGLRFVFAGRFATQKRLPLLMRAFRQVAKAHPDAQLLLAGANRSAGTERSVGGEDEAALGALVAHPNIHALGQVADMPSLFAAVDVFVLPSASEGLSNALLEACAAGLPSVSARIGGNSDVIAEGETGLMFTADDEADLALQMSRLADAGLRARLGQAARRRVCAGFDIRVTAQRLDALYHDLCRHG